MSKSEAKILRSVYGLNVLKSGSVIQLIPAGEFRIHVGMKPLFKAARTLESHGLVDIFDTDVPDVIRVTQVTV